MGFYNDGEGTVRRKASRAWVASVLLAGVVGSGTTLLTVPLLAKLQNTASNTSTVKAANSNIVAQSVATHVNSDIVQAVNKVKPAVVTVVNLQQNTGFFSRNNAQQTATGSGVLIDKKGHIVTNNHVVEGASEVDIVINQETIKAKVLGTDPFTDLAVLEVPVDKVKGIEPVEIGQSEAVQTGEPAIAIGNPLGQFEQTVTVGVISAKNRNLPVQDQAGNDVYEQSVLQTDAAINPGNSGGALVNVQGQLIGINSAKIASSGVEGIGFAIPIDEAKPIIDQLLTDGKVTRPVSVTLQKLPD